MRWVSFVVAALAVLVLCATAGAWLVIDRDVTHWLAEDPSCITPDDLQRAYTAVTWRDTVRYLGPGLLLVLLLTRIGLGPFPVLATRLRHDLAELAARWGAVRIGVLVACLAVAPICLAAGANHVADHLRIYAGLRCPPQVVMTSPAERVCGSSWSSNAGPTRTWSSTRSSATPRCRPPFPL